MPTEQRKKKRINRKVLFPACAIVAVVAGIQPAFAGATADLLYSIIGIIISAISGVIIGILEIILNVLLFIMGTSVNDLKTFGLLAGFDSFNGIIRALALGIASVAVLWQLTTILFGPYLDVKQTKSVGTIFTRTLIFIPLTYVIQPVAFAAFSEMQKIYTAILTGYSAASGNAFIIQLSNQINVDTFLEDMLTVGAAASTPVGAAATIFNGLSAAFQAMVSTIIATVFMVLILWNLLKLVIEIMQRFVIMIVYVYLSPLATACGVIGNGEIPKKGLAVFVSSGVLWILNVWCVGVGCSLIKACGSSIANGILGVFTWGFVTYGFLKIAQQLDDIFNAVGATNVRLSGSLLDELVSLGQLPLAAARAMSTMQRAYQSYNGKSGGSTGKNPKNPVSPSGVGGNAANVGRGGKNGSVAPDGTAATSTHGTAVPAANKVANAAVKGGNATAAITAKKDATGAQVKGLDNALNMTGDSEEKTGKLQEMHKEDPNVFNKPEVKNWMGENQLGLDKDKQALVDAGYNPESGEMSGIVATDKGNGKVALDKVSDLESTRSGAGNERAINAQQSSLSAERAKAGEAQRAGDFTGSKTNGADAATFGYTDANGVQHTAHLERTNSADAANGEFRMRTDSGETATISAPKDMSATDVAGVINGSASSDVKGAYSEFQNQAGPYSKASETSASTAASSLGVDTNAGGSVAAAMSGGQTAGSSGRDFATFNYTDKDGVQHTAQMEKLDTPSSDHSEFKMVLDDGREPVINAPKDASAHDVASMVNGTASESVRDAFESHNADGPGIVNAQAATNVDTSKGGAVMSGTAFENSPNTIATVSGASGENAVSLERVERGTAPGGKDVWSATKDGVEIGRMEVEKDTGAAEVMSRVMNDTSDDFASVRSNAGLDTDNPYVSFSRSSSPAGPEPMHCDIEPNAPGTRTNGSTWHSFGEVGFGTDDSGHEQVSFNYNAQGDHGLFTPASAKITDTGLEVFSEVSGPDKDGIIDIAATGKVYDISGEGINGGSVRVVVDNKASVEDIASAVLAGGGAASSISGVENIREAMGITETMNPGSESTLKRFFNAARNKSRTNNKDNPVDAE